MQTHQQILTQCTPLPSKQHPSVHPQPSGTEKKRKQRMSDKTLTEKPRGVGWITKRSCVKKQNKKRHEPMERLFQTCFWTFLIYTGDKATRTSPSSRYWECQCNLKMKTFSRSLDMQHLYKKGWLLLIWERRALGIWIKVWSAANINVMTEDKF